MHPIQYIDPLQPLSATAPRHQVLQANGSKGPTFWPRNAWTPQQTACCLVIDVLAAQRSSQANLINPNPDQNSKFGQKAKHTAMLDSAKKHVESNLKIGVGLLIIIRFYAAFCGCLAGQAQHIREWTMSSKNKTKAKAKAATAKTKTKNM